MMFKSTPLGLAAHPGFKPHTGDFPPKIHIVRLTVEAPPHFWATAFYDEKRT